MLEQMVLMWEMFCEVIGSVAFAWFPNQVELALLYTVFYPLVLHVESFREFLAEVSGESFWRRLAVRTPLVLELSVDIRFPLAGCGWLSLYSAVMIGTACWLLMKMLPVSASAAEETTFLGFCK